MGRPRKKPHYDSEKIMKELIDAVVESFEETGELKLTAAEFEMSPIKIRKLLITADVYENEISAQVQDIYKETKSISQVMVETGLSRASVSGYLPYQKMVYGAEELSVAAERTDKYRRRKNAVSELHDADDPEQALWNAIVEFEGYVFRTVTGLKFKYELKRGRSGGRNREIIIDRMKDSKSLTWSSVMLAYDKIEPKEYIRPKELSDSRGISYLFSIFYRFGLIDVDEKLALKLQQK